MKLSVHRKLLSVAVGLAVLTLSVDNITAAEKVTALTVVVAPVSTRALENEIVATGNVVAWREVPVGSEASGLAVTEVVVDEGDLVQKGQLLARLSSSILNAQIAQQTASIIELEATLAAANSDAQRARSLSTGVISAQVTEQRETLVRTTTAKIAAARAALDEANARLRQTDIVAPAAGTIAARSIAAGQVLQTGTEMFRLIQDNRIEVDALVPEADLFDIRPGQSVRVSGPTGQAQMGSVRLVAPLVDAKTRLGTVRVALSPETTLKPGMFARVNIATDAKTSLAVPLKALVWNQAKPGVFTVADPGTATLTEVVIGRKTSDSVEIVSGLRAGDRVVVQGAGLLKDGDSVRIEMASADEGTAQ